MVCKSIIEKLKTAQNLDMAKFIKNSQGKPYFIKSRTTKKGNITYYLTGKEDETCLNDLPNGYEVFEKYDSGMMFIRKKKKSLFGLEEINALKSGLNKNKSIADYKLNIDGGEMSIYAVTIDSGNSGYSGSFMSDLLGRMKMDGVWRRYDESMKIIIEKSDTEKVFEIQRYCYRGRIDDWITIGYETDISEVGRKYLCHIGKESYYDLM